MIFIECTRDLVSSTAIQYSVCRYGSVEEWNAIACYYFILVSSPSPYKVPIGIATIVFAAQTSIRTKARIKILNIHPIPFATRTASTVDTHELLRNLGQFPSSVLPTGLLRELQLRGDAIHDSLVTSIGQVIDSVDDDLRSDSKNIFFAFALLVPIAKIDDRPLIESLLTLPEKTIDCLIGDLINDAMPRLIANFFIEQSASEVIDWIERLADHPKLKGLNACVLFRAMTIAVSRGHLDRDTAIEVLVNQLKKRADEHYDLHSALVVCELMDLSARNLEAVDALVRASFGRNQIDLDYVGINSWDDIDSHDVSGRDEKTWNDPAAELSGWSYDFTSDDLSPVNATFCVNEASNRWSRLTESSVLALVDQLRKSTDDLFPREAVKSINNTFADAYHATIDLIREELARYQSDSDSWSGNGAYLGLALTVAHQMPLPTDLLNAILQMPEKDREQVFGDQFGLIVQMVSLTPLQNHDFMEQWIWDDERSNPDRREMIEAYLYACRNGHLDREVAIHTLVAGLRRALLEESILIGPYAENLAFLTPKEHAHVLNEAFNRDDVEWFIPLQDLRRMVQDAKFARDHFRECSHRYRSVDRIVSAGVMFNKDGLQAKPRSMPPLVRDYQPQPEIVPTKTIRNEVRIQRNDPCPCGSGKKYKKCCLNK